MSNKPQQYRTAKRRRFVLDQKADGKTHREVVAAAKEKFGEDSLPNGYNTYYVSKDIDRALDKVQSAVEASAEKYRTLHIRRLRRMLSRLMPLTEPQDVTEVQQDGSTVEYTKAPDPRIVGKVLGIMNELADLHGVFDLGPAADTDSESPLDEINQELLEGS